MDSEAIDTITLTHAELARIIAQAVTAAMGAQAPAGPVPDAERARAYRRRRASRNVTENVTPSGKPSRNVTENVTIPSPSPLSPRPPISPPPPASDRVGVHACEGREGQEPETSGPDSRQQETKAPDSGPPPPPAKPPKPPTRRQAVEADIAAANAQLPPPDLRSEGFPEAWDEWREHRTALYRREPRKRWSAQAARNTLHECARHGPAVAVMAIRAAIANGWQGLVWDRLKPNHPHHGNDSRAGRPPVSRNVSPLPAGLPSLNDTAVNAPGGARLAQSGGPGAGGDGKSYW